MIPKRKKILEIINDGTAGGGQVHIQQLLNCLNRKQFLLMVMCSPQGELIDDLIRESDIFSPIRINKGIDPLSLVVNMFYVFKIYQFIRTHRIDVVHTHGGIAGLWGRLAAILAQQKVIVHTHHGIHFLRYQNRPLKKIYILLERYLSRHTHRVICVSESDRENGLHNQLFKDEKCAVIKNGIDLFKFKKKRSIPAKAEYEIEENECVICHVGRLDPVKGQIYLLDALKRVIKIIPKVKLLIVGTGPLGKKLVNHCHQLNLNNHVRFLNYRKDIFNILSMSDLFVLSSLWEGLPLSIMEAMALEKPVVATDVDGVREVIENGKEGLLVPPKNSKSLAEAIVKLLRDRTLAKAMGKRAKKKVDQQFDVNRMIKQTENLYLKVCR